MFVSDNRVPVSDDKGNTIYIRPKMNVGQRDKVSDALVTVEIGATETPDQKVTPIVNWGAYQTATLLINIVGWEGPDFDGIPCTEANILKLDPDAPLVEKVRDEIAKRNKKKQDGPSPNSSMSDGGSSWTESGSESRPESMIYTSPSPTNGDGPLRLLTS